MSDISNRSDLINQLRVALPPEEFKKINFGELSDAELQAKLNEALTKNKNWGEFDGFDRGTAAAEQDVLTDETTIKYKNQSGDEVTEKRQGDTVVERVIKHTVENGKVVETVITYQEGKPVRKTKKEDGKAVESLFIHSDGTGAILKYTPDGTHKLQVSKINDEFDYSEEDIISDEILEYKDISNTNTEHDSTAELQKVVSFMQKPQTGQLEYDKHSIETLFANLGKEGREYVKISDNPQKYAIQYDDGSISQTITVNNSPEVIEYGSSLRSTHGDREYVITFAEKGNSRNKYYHFSPDGSLKYVEITDDKNKGIVTTVYSNGDYESARYESGKKVQSAAFNNQGQQIYSKQYNWEDNGQISDTATFYTEFAPDESLRNTRVIADSSGNMYYHKPDKEGKYTILDRMRVCDSIPVLNDKNEIIGYQPVSDMTVSANGIVQRTNVYKRSSLNEGMSAGEHCDFSRIDNLTRETAIDAMIDALNTTIQMLEDKEKGKSWMDASTYIHKFQELIGKGRFEGLKTLKELVSRLEKLKSNTVVYTLDKDGNEIDSAIKRLSHNNTRYENNFSYVYSDITGRDYDDKEREKYIKYNQDVQRLNINLKAIYENYKKNGSLTENEKAVFSKILGKNEFEEIDFQAFLNQADASVGEDGKPNFMNTEAGANKYAELTSDLLKQSELQRAINVISGDDENVEGFGQVLDLVGMCLEFKGIAWGLGKLWQGTKWAAGFAKTEKIANAMEKAGKWYGREGKFAAATRFMTQNLVMRPTVGGANFMTYDALHETFAEVYAEEELDGGKIWSHGLTGFATGYLAGVGSALVGEQLMKLFKSPDGEKIVEAVEQAMKKGAKTDELVSALLKAQADKGFGAKAVGFLAEAGTFGLATSAVSLFDGNEIRETLKENKKYMNLSDEDIEKMSKTDMMKNMLKMQGVDTEGMSESDIYIAYAKNEYVNQLKGLGQLKGVERVIGMFLTKGHAAGAKLGARVKSLDLKPDENGQYHYKGKPVSAEQVTGLINHAMAFDALEARLQNEFNKYSKAPMSGRQFAELAYGKPKEGEAPRIDFADNIKIEIKDGGYEVTTVDGVVKKVGTLEEVLQIHDEAMFIQGVYEKYPDKANISLNDFAKMLREQIASKTVSPEPDISDYNGRTISDFEVEAKNNGINYEVITDENGNRMVRRVVQSVEVLGMGKTTYEVTVFDKEGKQISDTVEMSRKDLKTAHPSFFTKKASTKAVDNSHTNFKSGSPNDIERPQDPFELDGKFLKEQMEQTGVDILKNTGLKNKKGKDIYETTPEADKIIFALAEQIREVALKNEPQIVQFMREMGFASDNSVFKDKDGNPIDISHRSKSVQSLHDKILNELLDDPKMNLAQAVNAVRDGVGVRTASKIIEDYSKFDDVKSALDKGDRATALEKAIEHESAETFKALMNYLQSVHDGTNKVEITRISNYMGADGIPYFTENQIHALKVEAERLGVDLPIFERVQSLAEKEIVKTKEAETGKEIKSNTQIRYSGYTGLQINFRVKETGFVFEWQNRGELVNEFAEKEHVPYDLRTGKDIIGKNTELNGLYGPIKEILGEDKMDKTVYTEYENYLAAHYEYLRLQELGFTEGVPQPKLPAGMDTRLRAENLDLLHTYAEKIKEKAADIREQGRKTGKTDAQIEAEVQQSVEPLIKEYQDKLVLNTPENTTTESYTEKAKSKENSRMISQYDAVTRLGGNHKNPNLPEINEIVEVCKLNGKAISEKLIAHAEKLKYEEVEKDEIIKQVNELKAELYGIENKVNKQERKTFPDFESEARDNGTNYEVITDENGNRMVRRVIQSVEVFGMGKTIYEVTVFDKEGKQISDTVEMSGKELKTAHPSFFTKKASTRAVDNSHAGTLGMNTITDGRVPSLDAPQDGAITRGIQDNAGAKETIAQIQGKNIKILDNGTKRVTEPIKWTTQDGKSLEYTLIRDYTADKNIMYRVIDKDNTVVGEWYGFISEDKHESYLKGYSLWTDRSGRNTSGLGTELKKLIYNDAKNYNCNSIKIDAAYKSHTFHNKMGYKCDITNDYLEPIIATLKVIKLKNTIPEFNGRIENVLGNKNIVEINLLIDDILSYANSNDLRSEDIGIKDIKIPMKYELKNDNSGRVDFSLPQDGRVPSLDASQNGSRSALPSRQSDGAIKGNNATFTPTKTDGAIPTVPTKSSVVVQAESELSGVAKGMSQADVSEIASACVDSDGSLNKNAVNTARTFLKLGRDKAFVLTMVQKFVKPKPSAEVNNAEITQPVKAEEKTVQNPAETIQHSKTEDEFKTYIQGLNRYKSSTIGILTNLYKTHGDMVLEMVNKTKKGSPEPRFTDMDIITFMNSKHKDYDMAMLDATIQNLDGNVVDKFTPKDVRLIRDTIRDDNKLKSDILEYIKDNLANDDTVSSDVVMKFVKSITKDTETQDFGIIIDILKDPNTSEVDKNNIIDAYNSATSEQKNQVTSAQKNNSKMSIVEIIKDIIMKQSSTVKGKKSDVLTIILDTPELSDIPNYTIDEIQENYTSEQLKSEIENIKLYLQKHPNISVNVKAAILMMKSVYNQKGLNIDVKSIVKNDLYTDFNALYSMMNITRKILPGEKQFLKLQIMSQMALDNPEIFKKNARYILLNGITNSEKINDIMKYNIDYEQRKQELSKYDFDDTTREVLQRTENISDISGIRRTLNNIKIKTGEIKNPENIADILNKVKIDDYELFNKFIENINMQQLYEIAPKMKDFSDKELAIFFAYHYQNNTMNFTAEKLSFTKDFTEFLTKHYINSENMSELLCAYPNIDRNVGELPDGWTTDNSLTRKITDIIDNFRKSRDNSELETSLRQTLGKSVKVETLDSGLYGVGYKIDVEGSNSVVLKLFHEQPQTNINIPLHGQRIETQTGLFLNNNSNQFVHMYFGRIASERDKDGFLVTQFMDEGGKPIITSGKNEDYIIDPKDFDEKGHNKINGMIIDYGLVNVTKSDGSDASFGLFKNLQNNVLAGDAIPEVLSKEIITDIFEKSNLTDEQTDAILKDIGMTDKDIHFLHWNKTPNLNQIAAVLKHISDNSNMVQLSSSDLRFFIDKGVERTDINFIAQLMTNDKNLNIENILGNIIYRNYNKRGKDSYLLSEERQARLDVAKQLLNLDKADLLTEILPKVWSNNKDTILDYYLNIDKVEKSTQDIIAQLKSLYPTNINIEDFVLTYAKTTEQKNVLCKLINDSNLYDVGAILEYMATSEEITKQISDFVSKESDLSVSDKITIIEQSKDGVPLKTAESEFIRISDLKNSSDFKAVQEKLNNMFKIYDGLKVEKFIEQNPNSLPKIDKYLDLIAKNYTEYDHVYFSEFMEVLKGHPELENMFENMIQMKNYNGEPRFNVFFLMKNILESASKSEGHKNLIEDVLYEKEGNSKNYKHENYSVSMLATLIKDYSPAEVKTVKDLMSKNYITSIMKEEKPFTINEISDMMEFTKTKDSRDALFSYIDSQKYTPKEIVELMKLHDKYPNQSELIKNLLSLEYENLPEEYTERKRFSISDVDELVSLYEQYPHEKEFIEELLKKYDTFENGKLQGPRFNSDQIATIVKLSNESLETGKIVKEYIDKNYTFDNGLSRSFTSNEIEAFVKYALKSPKHKMIVDKLIERTDDVYSFESVMDEYENNPEYIESIIDMKKTDENGNRVPRFDIQALDYLKDLKYKELLQFEELDVNDIGHYVTYNEARERLLNDEKYRTVVFTVGVKRWYKELNGDDNCIYSAQQNNVGSYVDFLYKLCTDKKLNYTKEEVSRLAGCMNGAYEEFIQRLCTDTSLGLSHKTIIDTLTALNLNSGMQASFKDKYFDLVYKICTEKELESAKDALPQITAMVEYNNIDKLKNLISNYRSLEITPNQITTLLSEDSGITLKQLQRLNRIMGSAKASKLNEADLKIACTFANLYGKQNINELPNEGKKDLLHSMVASNIGLFEISEELSKDFPLIPKNQQEYCSLLPSIVRSLGIETNELTPEQRITMFNSSMSELSKSLAGISDADFSKMHITQEYPKDRFIRDILDKVKHLSRQERQKVYDYFGFELHHNRHNETGFSITGYPVNLNNGKKLAQIDNPRTKAIVEEVRPLVIKFSENNRIKCDNTNIEQFLNEVISALPELRTTIGKSQHGSQDFDVMQHSLKVMQKVTQDSKFATLNKSDKKIMLLASLMHDITKSEGRVDKTHANEGSFDTYFIAQKFNLTKEEEVKLHTLIKSHEWLEYVNTSKSEDQLTKRLQSVAYDLHQGNLFNMAEIFTHADLRAVRKDDSFHDTTEGQSRIGFDGVARSFGQSADIYADRIRGYVAELQKSQPLLPQTKIPRASRINEAITQVNPDGSTNIKGVYKDKDGLIVIKFNEVEDWEIIGFPKGSISHGVEIKKGEKGDAELTEDVNTGNIKFFVHALEYSNQLAKFDAFSLVDSDALLSVSYAERPESKFRFFRTQGVILDVNSKYIHGGGNTDAGSGYGKDINEFKQNYIFGGYRQSDRTYVSDLIKKTTGMSDEQYVEFVEKNKDKSLSEIEPVEMREKLIKAFATINSNTRKGKRSYNEMYISNPNEVMGVFAYSTDYEHSLGNPVEFLNKSTVDHEYRLWGDDNIKSVKDRTEFLRQYALERNLPFIIFGD